MTIGNPPTATELAAVLRRASLRPREHATSSERARWRAARKRDDIPTLVDWTEFYLAALLVYSFPAAPGEELSAGKPWTPRRRARSRREARRILEEVMLPALEPKVRAGWPRAWKELKQRAVAAAWTRLQRAETAAEDRQLEAKRASTNPQTSLRREYTLPLARVARSKDVRDALARFRRFHGAAPTRARVFEYEDGREDVDERVAFKVGDAHVRIEAVEGADGRMVPIRPLEIGTAYTVPPRARSNKAGRQWIHSHREAGGKPPIHAVDVRTGLLTQLGGTYSVDDWIRR